MISRSLTIDSNRRPAFRQSAIAAGKAPAVNHKSCHPIQVGNWIYWVAIPDDICPTMQPVGPTQPPPFNVMSGRFNHHPEKRRPRQRLIVSFQNGSSQGRLLTIGSLKAGAS